MSNDDQPVRPGSQSRPRQCGATFAHCVSFKIMPIKAAAHLGHLTHVDPDLIRIPTQCILCSSNPLAQHPSGLRP